jgi:hypothetical protein
MHHGGDFGRKIEEVSPGFTLHGDTRVTHDGCGKDATIPSL